VANTLSNNVSGYTIDPSTGALTAIAGSPFPEELHAHPTSVAVDPSGKFAYVANKNFENEDFLPRKGTISGYTIDPSTGALTAIAGSPFKTAGLFPTSVAVDPSGKFAYVANVGSNNVLGYTINPTTGALAPMRRLKPIMSGSQPFSVAVDPSGKFAYVANLNLAGNVSGYAINPTSGRLTLIAGTPFAAGREPDSVAVDPSGKFAYVANQADNNVSGYAINPTTGALTPIAGSPFSAGSDPFSVAVARVEHPAFAR
jgi:6-phosphogluconolactonase